MTEKRGRPRSFDPDRALSQALTVFWTNGFSGTSLDQIAEATGLNRPSIYNAFGDKQSLYRAALSAFRMQLEGGLEALADGQELNSALRHFFATALDVYTTGEPPLGCFIFCTAPAEAITSKDIRADMLQIATQTDQALKRVFSRAQKNGQLPDDTDPLAAAQLTQATLHSLALRARAGQPRSVLNKMAKGAVEIILGGNRR